MAAHELDAECKFVPEISEKARELAGSRNVPLLQRFSDLQVQRTREMDTRRKELEEENLEGVTFQPTMATKRPKGMQTKASKFRNKPGEKMTKADVNDFVKQQTEYGEKKQAMLTTLEKRHADEDGCRDKPQISAYSAKVGKQEEVVYDR